MAKTLFDTVNEQLTRKPVAPQLGQTEQAQSLLRAKLGKAGTTTAVPRTSAIQENVASQQVQAGQAAQQQAGQVQAEQINQAQAGQVAKEAESMSDILSKREDIKQNFNLNTENLLQDAERNRQKLATDEYKAKLEQVGFNIRLNNKQYTDSLEMEAAQQQLDNDVKFKYAMADQVFKDEQETLSEFLDFQRLIDADDRVYQEELSRMGDDFALEIAKKEIEAERKKKKYEAVGKMVGVGASVYGQSGGGASGSSSSSGAGGGSGATNTYGEAE